MRLLAECRRNDPMRGMIHVVPDGSDVRHEGAGVRG
jgi:hypothetical protein